MKKITSDIDFIQSIDNFNRKQIIDVGCGTGNLVRWFAEQKANITGIDIEPMLSKALAQPRSGNENYINGVGENLPFEDNFADYIFYAASFHHIPLKKMHDGIKECNRVLKQNGQAIFIEPVSRKDTYYELVKLLADEHDIQQNAISALKAAINIDFQSKSEKYYYFERSLDDYKNLLNLFEENETVRSDCFDKATRITKRYAELNDIPTDQFRYKSIIRVNIFQKD